MYSELNAQKALIFRITHRDNVPWMLENGLHCRNSRKIDPNYVSIGNADLIDKRALRTVPCPPGGTLSDYVPFYFTPFSPMLYNIRTGHGGIPKRPNDEIVIIVSSLPKLTEMKASFLFTDRHAYLVAAQFFADLAQLDQIDWPSLQKRDFARNANDPAKFERYQAEALAHKHLPIDAVLGIVCSSDSVASSLQTHVTKRGLVVTVTTKPGWYF
jgi:ssDNA thymidine ADP-ribosyltransferase, DarT